MDVPNDFPEGKDSRLMRSSSCLLLGFCPEARCVGCVHSLDRFLSSGRKKKAKFTCAKKDACKKCWEDENANHWMPSVCYAHLMALSEIEWKGTLSMMGGANVADIMDDTDDYGKPTTLIDPSPQPTSTTTQKTNPPPVAEEASPGRSAIAWIGTMVTLWMSPSRLFAMFCQPPELSNNPEPEKEKLHIQVIVSRYYNIWR